MMPRDGKTTALAAMAAGLSLFAVAGPAAFAQPVVQPLPRSSSPSLSQSQMQSRPVVQPLPVSSGSQSLNAALGRLARDPRDLSALIDAGKAAVQMGDIDAALGFFARADQISPNNMQVKAGLAAAMVRGENPFDAIPLFAEADGAGASDPSVQSDRGLAYDLVGDSATAQRYYQQSLAARSDDETLRRLGLSQAIAGDRAGMELTLSPLLQKQDKAAWRTRAFALAILGRPDEAVAIANQTMPTDLASGIAPYLRYMPRLTAAQQAAAANFGRFPRAADIGHDDPRVALYAPPKRVPVQADAALVPAGEPLGNARNTRRARQAPTVAAAAPIPAPARSAPPEPMPNRQVGTPPALATASLAPPPVPAARSAAALVPPAPTAVLVPRLTTPPVAPPVMAAPAPRPALTVAAPGPVASPAPAVAMATTTMTTTATAALPRPAAASATAAPAAVPAPAFAAAPGFDLARVGQSAPSAGPVSAVAPALATPAPAAPAAAAPAVTAPAVARAGPASAPAPVLASAPAPARPRRVADAFADLAAPTTSAAPAPGAVDVRKIVAPRPKPPEPPKPVHPSRIWVQVGTGRNVQALGFTWRGLVKDNPELFKGKSASVSDWGRTNRLLTGPFATEAAADTFLGKLKKKDVDAFLWTSPAGQVVDDL
jgi:Flp pilus assembly protein TadD